MLQPLFNEIHQYGTVLALIFDVIGINIISIVVVINFREHLNIILLGVISILFIVTIQLLLIIFSFASHIFVRSTALKKKWTNEKYNQKRSWHPKYIKSMTVLKVRFSSVSFFDIMTLLI